MISGHIVRILTTSVFTIFLARTLGRSGFGLFMGIVALASVVAPLSGLGLNGVIMSHLSKDPSQHRSMLGHSIFLIIVLGIPISGFVTISGLLLFNESNSSWWIIFAIVFSECVLFRIHLNVGVIFQALEQLEMTSMSNAIYGSSKLAAVLIGMFLVDPLSIEAWANIYLATNLVVTLIDLFFFIHHFGLPKKSTLVPLSTIKLGFPFAIGSILQSLYTDSDKILLTNIHSSVVNGIYNAAYKIVIMFIMPIQSFVASQAPHFFRVGFPTARILGNRSMSYSIGIGIFAAIIVFISCPYLSWILGKEYTESAQVLRYLTVLPILQSVHMVLGEVLAASGLQRMRVFGQFIATVVNVILNLLFIPIYSWKAAVWSTLICETLLLILFYCFTNRGYRRLSIGKSFTTPH